MNEQIIKRYMLEGSNREGLSGATLDVKLGPGLKALIREQRIVLGLSLPLVTLVITCSTIGLLYPGIYHFPIQAWLTQAVAQDAINLFLVTPVLLVAALYSFHGVKLALLMWGGTLAYLVHTFLIYCLSNPLSTLFLPYCLVLILAAYSLGWFIVKQLRMPLVTKLATATIQKVIGTYFVVTSSAFYILWLLDVSTVPFLYLVPKTLADMGFNPVHQIGLPIFLAIVFIIGVMSIKSRPFTAVLMPVGLIYIILMDTTVSVLTIVLMQNGYGGSMILALTLGGLAVFSLLLLIILITQVKEELMN